MNWYRKNLILITAMALTLSVSVLAHGQGPKTVSATTSATSADEPSPAPLPTAPEPQQSTADDTPDGWRGQIAIYGWFPGIHGTVGVLGHDAGERLLRPHIERRCRFVQQPDRSRRDK